MTYKEVARLIKIAAQSTVQSTNNQVNEAYQDILRGMSPLQTQGGAINTPAQTSGGFGSGLAGLAVGLGLSAAFLPTLLGDFKNKIPTGQQFGRDAYNGIKQAVGQDLTNAGNAVKNFAGQAWDKTKQVFKDFSQYKGIIPTNAQEAERMQQEKLDAMKNKISDTQVQQARLKRQQMNPSLPVTQADVNAQRQQRYQNPAYQRSPITQNEVQAQRRRRGLGPSRRVQQQGSPMPQQTPAAPTQTNNGQQITGN